MGKINIYLASHFFDAGGAMKTQFLADRLRSEFGDKIDLYVPQENGDINDKTQAVEYISGTTIATADNIRLDRADILIADMDGVEIDSGVSAEIGYIAGRNRMADKVKQHISELYLQHYPPSYYQGLEDIVDRLSTSTYILGFTTDIRINKVSDEVLQDLKETLDEDCVNPEGEVKWKIDNLKDNHLYRNLYTRGLIGEWGTYIRTNPSNYISDIIKEVRYVIANRGGLDA